jgi:transcriptional regulator with XRE-family HTH domain
MRKGRGTGKGAPTAIRVKRLREVLGFTSTGAFAAVLGYSPQRWGNIENGHPLSIEIAKRLCQKVPGLTLDWLYYGHIQGLPVDLAKSLGELPVPSGKRTKEYF